MNYKFGMQLIILFFYIITILACILTILRGKAFIVSHVYPNLFYIILVSFLFLSLGEDDRSALLLLVVLAMMILITILTARNQYIIWGVNEKYFYKIMENILRKNNLEYRVEGNNRITLLNYPGRLFQFNSLNILSLGINLKIINNKKGKNDQGELMSKIKDAVSGYPMSFSGRILLVPIILLTCCMLYIFFQVI